MKRKPNRCGECGAELRLGPATCPLCGASTGAAPARAEARDVDDYHDHVRKLRDELKKLKQHDLRAS